MQVAAQPAALVLARLDQRRARALEVLGGPDGVGGGRERSEQVLQQPAGVGRGARRGRRRVATGCPCRRSGTSSDGRGGLARDHLGRPVLGEGDLDHEAGHAQPPPGLLGPRGERLPRRRPAAEGTLHLAQHGERVAAAAVQ